MIRRDFSPGFRMSKMDMIVLVIGGVGSIFVSRYDRWIGLAIVFVVAHFFLFCNILRMSRALELCWATMFATLAVLASIYGLLSWPVVFACSAGFTLILAALEIRRPWYHGVGWQWINPRLEEWWKARMSATKRAKEIARAHCAANAWTWTGLVEVNEYKEQWHVRTNVGCRGCNASIVIDAQTGAILSSAFAPR